MTRPFSPLTARISGRGSDAWATHFEAMEAVRRGEDVIVLSVGDPDFDTPAPIVAAGVAAMTGGDTHYAEIPGRRHLREAIATRHQAATGRPTAWSDVMVTAGAQNALFVTVACLLGSGDHALVLEPAYVTYPATFGAAGASVDYVALSPETGFRLEAGRLAAAVRPETRAIVLSNPNNPTGCVLGEDELAAILEVARQHDLWVISDEVYADLVFEGRFRSLASLDQDGRVVTLGSLSKSHAMTGWRCGWLVGPVALVRHTEKLALAMLYGLPGFVQEAAFAAISAGPAVPEEMTRIYRRRRDLVHGILAGAPGLDAHLPEAGMFTMLDVSGTGMIAGAFARSLWRHERVSVLDGAAFGAPARDFVRISFASAEATLEEGARRIRRHAAALIEGRVVAAAV